jgi:serine protease Do
MKDKLIVILIALVAGFLGSMLHQNTLTDQAYSLEQFPWLENQFQIANNLHENEEFLEEPTISISNKPETLPIDFVTASEASTPNVVFIRTISRMENRMSWYDMFFEGRQGQSVSTGSGVVYSKDGYIITNNHVITNAERIEVILNKRTYDAELIGTDPSSDLAVLKIQGQNFSSIKIGSSANVKVGEWVLAVGNPFNLNSTVTAGIVSAKGRELNLLNSRFPIESFIQTDAAINPGNSGGALVNLKGELIGINTAILSRTGNYTGYGFAIPVDIVKKITDDLINYGEVQKAFLGANVSDLSEEMLVSMEGIVNGGVIIDNLQNDGAAENSGLNSGDIITQINGIEIDSRVEFDEQISFRSPGDEIQIQYLREGKKRTTVARLQNIQGTTGVFKREVYTSQLLGAQLETLTKVEKDLYRLESGVKIVELGSGNLRRLGLKKDYVITQINQVPVNDPKKLEEILSSIKGRVLIEGVNERGEPIYTSFVAR